MEVLTHLRDVSLMRDDSMFEWECW